MVWNISPFKGDFSGGKARSHRAPNLGCNRAELPGWFEVWPKNSAWDMMHEQAHCCDEFASHQLPIDVAFWIIQTVSVEECSSLMQNPMQICCFTRSVILNVTATQYTCLLNGVYHPHWLVQWSCHYSRMCIPVHSPWLPGYMDVMWTILVILTVAGLFETDLCISSLSWAPGDLRSFITYLWSISFQQYKVVRIHESGG